jgi:hypothetical protein
MNEDKSKGKNHKFFLTISTKGIIRKNSKKKLG